MIFNSHKSQKFLKYTIEHDLNLLIEWFKSNKLSFNFGKTVIMNFWSNSTVFNINVDGNTIPVIPYTKFLETYLDSELTWHVHLNNLIEKIQANK